MQLCLNMTRRSRASRPVKKLKTSHHQRAPERAAVTGVLSLPPELLTMICELVSDRDLLALTCTNRLLRDLAVRSR
jgi:hypothetical protein